MCVWWKLADIMPEIRKCCQSVVLVISGGCVRFHNDDNYVRGNICRMCDMRVKDSVEHFLCECTALSTGRMELLNEASMHAKSNNYLYMSLSEKWEHLLSERTYDTDNWTCLASVVAKGIHSMVVTKREFYD